MMLIELSYIIEEWCPGEVLDLAAPKIRPLARLSDGENNNQTSSIEIFSHNGTHIDVPWHVTKEGRQICDYDIRDFVFTKPVLIEIAKSDGELLTVEDIAVHAGEIEGCDLLLIYTGHGQYRRIDPERYVLDSPTFSLEAAHFIMEHFPSLRCVGIDIFGVENIPAGIRDDWPVHKAFLAGERPFLLIEDMKLDEVLNKSMHLVVAAPLRAEGLDGSPATVIAHIKAE